MSLARRALFGSLLAGVVALGPGCGERVPDTSRQQWAQCIPGVWEGYEINPTGKGCYLSAPRDELEAAPDCRKFVIDIFERGGGLRALTVQWSASLRTVRASWESSTKGSWKIVENGIELEDPGDPNGPHLQTEVSCNETQMRTWARRYTRVLPVELAAAIEKTTEGQLVTY